MCPVYTRMPGSFLLAPEPSLWESWCQVPEGRPSRAYASHSSQTTNSFFSGKCATNLKWNYGKKSAVFPTTPPTHASCWGLVGLQRNRELSTHQLLDNSSVWLERAGTQGTGRALRVCPVFRSISARGSPGLDCHQLIGAMPKSSR